MNSQNRYKLIFATTCLITLFFSLSAAAAPTCKQFKDTDNVSKWKCCDGIPQLCETHVTEGVALENLNTALRNQAQQNYANNNPNGNAVSCLKSCNNCEAHDLQQKWPASPLGGVKLGNCSKLGDLIKYLYNWGISLGGIAVFIALVIAGFEYITSIGNPGKMKEAVERIQSAAIGLALLLGSYAIFSLINPNINTIKGNFSMVDYSNDKTCTSSNECCKIRTYDPKTHAVVSEADDPNCSPDDWNCCPTNDIKCMKTGQASKDSRSGWADGACCCSNDVCASGFCNPNTSQCAPTNKICIKKFDNGEKGCDVVRFYKAANFSGNTKNVDYYEYTYIDNSNVFNSPNFKAWPDPSWYPGSFEAFKYKRNKDGVPLDDNNNPAFSVTDPCEGDISGTCYAVPAYGPIAGVEPALIKCGSSGCGCSVILCLQLDTGDQTKCAEDSETEQNTTYPLPAYAPVYQNTRIAQAFIISDESKKDPLSKGWDTLSANADYLWGLIWQ